MCVACAPACAARIVRPPNYMQIYNVGRQQIAELKTKHCDEADDQFKSLAGSAIPRGQSYALPLLEGCVELIAVGPEGEVLGRQANLHMMAGSTWTIR